MRLVVLVSVGQAGHIFCAAAVAYGEGFGAAVISEVLGFFAVPDCFDGGISDIAEGVIGEIDTEVGLAEGLDIDEFFHI